MRGDKPPGKDGFTPWVAGPKGEHRSRGEGARCREHLEPHAAVLRRDEDDVEGPEHLVRQRLLADPGPPPPSPDVSEVRLAEVLPTP